VAKMAGIPQKVLEIALVKSNAFKEELKQIKKLLKKS